MNTNQTVTAGAQAPGTNPAIRLPSTEPNALTPETRWQRTAVAAFYRAEARGFAPGRELDDWLAAERELEAADTGGGPGSQSLDAPVTPSALDSHKVTSPARQRAGAKGGKSARGARVQARNRGDES
jgi:Protein of unknown function (DUF2934)